MGMKLRASKLAPWAGLVAGMLAEGLHHQVLSDMLRFDCLLGGPAAGLLLGVPALALVALGAWLSWASVRGVDPAEPQQHNRRFIARLSLMGAALLAVGIVWQTLATAIVPACAP